MSALPAASAAPAGSGGAFVALLALLAWAPVPLGSNRGWSQALLAAGVLGLGFAVLLARLWRGPAPRPPALRWTWPLALLAAFAALAFAQMLPLPPALLRLLSATAQEAWLAAGVDGAASLSLDRGATAARGLHLASLAVLFALTCWCVNSRRRLQVACVALVGVGTAQALIGIVLALAQSRGWLATGPVQGVGGASGTFVNPNHFAGLLEMTLCVSVGLALSTGFTGAWPASGREAAQRAVAFALSPRMPLLGAQLLMLVALLWSGSRGALAALALALAAVVALVLPPSPDAPPRARAATLALAAALATLALIWGGPGSLGAKLQSQGLHSDRPALYAATLAMARDFPIAGAGAGSFRSVFPAYKTEALGTPLYEHAHNDFLEILAESGVLGLTLFLGAVGSALWLAFRHARRRRSRQARAVTAGCAAGAISLLVHGLYDFNLYIPANASIFVVVLALALAGATLPREGPAA